MRKCYGVDYPYKFLYNPGEIVKALEVSLMHSVVAFDAEGTLVGHCALTFESPTSPVPEAGKMIVDPVCRGQLLSNQLSERRKAISRDMGLVGYWSECVTNHPFSQHEIIESGGMEVGVFFAKVPILHMAGVNNVTDVRLTLMTYYIPMRDAPRRTIYLMGPYADFVQELAAELGIAREVVSTAKLDPVSSSYGGSVDLGSQFAQISVSTIGSDLADKVAKTLSDIMAQGIAVIHLDLPLDQPNSLVTLPELENLGFFWAAWLPEYAATGDVLRLQKTDAAVNAEEIVCARDHGERIKQHVLAERKRVMKL